MGIKGFLYNHRTQVFAVYMIAVVLGAGFLILGSPAMSASALSGPVDKKMPLMYPGLNATKHVLIDGVQHVETITVLTEKQKLEYAVLTFVPSRLAKGVEEIRISTNGQFNAVSNQPLLIVFEPKNSPNSLMFKMEFFEAKKNISTLNFIVPVAFERDLSKEQKQQLVEKIANYEKFKLSAESTNQIENELNGELARLFQLQEI